MRKPEYIRFMEEDAQHLKTRIVHVVTVRSNVLLGVISWYAPWRQYTFRPESGTIFNPDCLAQIQEVTGNMTKVHRETRAAAREA